MFCASRPGELSGGSVVVRGVTGCRVAFAWSLFLGVSLSFHDQSSCSFFSVHICLTSSTLLDGWAGAWLDTDVTSLQKGRKGEGKKEVTIGCEASEATAADMDVLCDRGTDS